MEIIHRHFKNIICCLRILGTTFIMALLQARFNPIIKYSLFISLDMTLNNFVTKKGSTNHRCRIYHTQIQLEYYEYDIDISWNRLHDAKTMMYFLREKE